MSSGDDHVCRKCGNTGKSVATGHYCGCIHGERLLREQHAQWKEKRAERLAQILADRQIIEWQTGEEWTNLVKEIELALAFAESKY